MGTPMNGNGYKVVAPERNHYFYGKLMDVVQFEKEQRYFNRQRRLINRLVLGSGVICGLNAVAGDDGTITIEPGAALDALGREIIVPYSLSIDPQQLTDEEGMPSGDPIDTGSVDICLAYAEKKVDPVPVLVPDCDTGGDCAHATIREGFRVLILLAEDPLPPPPDCQSGEVQEPASEWLQQLLCERISNTSLEPAMSRCIHLARVSLPLSAASIDAQAGRPLVYNHSLLYELILCLSEQVEQLAQGQTLRYVSGDGQSGPPGKALAGPLIVEVVDGKGNAVENVLVQFSVTQGDGKLDNETAMTDKQGRAQTIWTLGLTPGEQQVSASAVGSVFTATFRATAVADK
jgi:hypothetical protein